MALSRWAFFSLLILAQSLVLTRAPLAKADITDTSVEDVANFVQTEISKATISLDVRILNLDIAKGINLEMGYDYKTEPSYIDSYYTRYDSWYSNLGITPSSFIVEAGSPFTFGITPGTNIVFARQFKSQKAASLAEPYTPVKNLPLSSELALKTLAPGDFVAFNSNLNLAIGYDPSMPVGPITLIGGINGVLSGSFLIHIYKKDETKIRLKLIGVHSVTGSAGTQARLLNQIRLIALALNGNKIERFWQISLADLDTRAALADVMMLDYMLDLSDPEVAAAYDHLFQRPAILKGANILMPVLGSSGGVQKDALLITDLSELENLFQKNLSKKPRDRSVDRLFKGSTLTSSSGQTSYINLEFLRFQKDSYYARNKITTRDEMERPLHYLFDTFSVLKDRNSWFDIFARKETINTNLLFTSSKKFDPERFVALVLSRELKTRTLSEADLRAVQDHVEQTLPPSLASTIPWSEWLPSLKSASSFYFRHQIYFPLEALIAMPVYDAETLKERYTAYLKTIPEPEVPETLPPRPDLEDITNRQLTPRPRGAERFAQDILIISNELAIAFDPKNPIQDRYNAFVRLKDNKLFQETGAGFLIRALPQENLQNLLGYSLEISGNGTPKREFRFGTVTDNELYHSMVYIQDILNNRSVDLRLLKQTAEPAPALPSIELN